MALFYFVFEGNFQVQAPGGAYIWRGDLTDEFLRYKFEGLIQGGAFFSEFYNIDVTSSKPRENHMTCAPFANLVHLNEKSEREANEATKRKIPVIKKER